MAGSPTFIETVKTKSPFEKGLQVAAGRDFAGLERNLALYVRVPGIASHGADIKIGQKQTLAKHNREFYLSVQENLRQFMAGYLTGCEKAGRTAEGVADLSRAYERVLQSFLGDVKDRLNKKLVDQTNIHSVRSLMASLNDLKNEARTTILKEKPIQTARNLDPLVAKALENDERWRSRYSSIKRLLAITQEEVKNLEAQERKLGQVLKNLPEIERASRDGADALAKTLSRLFKVPGRLEVLPTKIKIAGAVAVSAVIGMTLGFILGLSNIENKPKIIRPVKVIDF